MLKLFEKRLQFFCSKSSFKRADIAMFGVPFDSTVSFKPGARFGPDGIREVSEVVEDYSPDLDASLEDVNFVDLGNLPVRFGNPENVMKTIEKAVRQILKEGKKPFAIGGEHSISYPAISSVHKFHPDLHVIQFDAHLDLRKDYLGEKNSHASVMNKVSMLLGDGRVFQFGIRSGTKEEFEYAKKHTNIFRENLQEALNLSVKEIGDKPVYVTLDIDVIDPAYAPGTGTPEAGGITSSEMFKLLYILKPLNIAGFDLVEVSPPNDPSGITSVLAAKLIREALMMI